MNADSNEAARFLTLDEMRVVRALADAASIEVHESAIKAVQMNDGGMGSLRFATVTIQPRMGVTVAEVTYQDTDGTLVSITLSTDQDGRLFELDVWKVDFTRRHRWPSDVELRAAKKYLA